MAEKKRVQGQIWIGKEQPNVLKYFAGNTEYWTVTATTYLAGGTEENPVRKGHLLAVDPNPSSTSGKRVRAARWPQDATSIVGMALNDAGPSEEVRILNYGYVEFDEEALDNLFASPGDLKVVAAGSGYSTTLAGLSGGNDWPNSLSGKGSGQPVYWFSGRTIKSGANSYTWIDPAEYAGKLTFSTPCGYKPNKTDIPWGDDSFNINYKQLPHVGTVASYSVSGDKITNLVLHLNFSTFSNKIQFEYPAKKLGHYTEINTDTSVVIRHGLFPNNGVNYKFIPHVNITAWGYSDEEVATGAAGEAFNIHPGFDSFIGPSADKRTEIGMISDTPFYYKLAGEINYNF